LVLSKAHKVGLLCHPDRRAPRLFCIGQITAPPGSGLQEWVTATTAAVAGGFPRGRGRVMSGHLLCGLACRRALTHHLSRARGRLHQLLAPPVVAVVAGALLAITPAAPAQAACANPVVCENQLPGTPQSVWDVTSPSTAIQGFEDPFSVNVGSSINFKIKSPASSYKIDIYRMGYYGGNGARLVTSLTPNISVSQNQPTCNTNTVTGLVDCGNSGVSATW